jgi:hypothetical protein
MLPASHTMKLRNDSPTTADGGGVVMSPPPVASASTSDASSPIDPPAVAAAPHRTSLPARAPAMPCTPIAAPPMRTMAAINPSHAYDDGATAWSTIATTHTAPATRARGPANRVRVVIDTSLCGIEAEGLRPGRGRPRLSLIQPAPTPATVNTWAPRHVSPRLGGARYRHHRPGSARRLRVTARPTATGAVTQGRRLLARAASSR